MLGYAVFHQVLTGGHRGRNRAGGGDMVGGDRVADFDQDFGAYNWLDGSKAGAHVDEERRLLDISGLFIPGVERPFGDRDGVPLGVAVFNAVIFLVEGFRFEGIVVFGGNLGLRWPDILEINRPAIFADA